VCVRQSKCSEEAFFMAHSADSVRNDVARVRENGKNVGTPTFPFWEFSSSGVSSAARGISLHGSNRRVIFHSADSVGNDGQGFWWEGR
jgi:hypothetical protein